MLSDSLALRPLEFDVKESNNNVLSLMSSMDDEYDDIALVVEGTEGESTFEMPSGPISEAETPPVSVGGVLKSRYKGTWLWAMNEELKGEKIRVLSGYWIDCSRVRRPLGLDGCFHISQTRMKTSQRRKLDLWQRGSCKEKA